MLAGYRVYYWIMPFELICKSKRVTVVGISVNIKKIFYDFAYKFKHDFYPLFN